MSDLSTSSSDDERNDIEMGGGVEKGYEDEGSSIGSDEEDGQNSKAVLEQKREKHEIEDADELRAAGLVSAYAKLDGDTAFSSRKPRFPINLEWRNIHYKVILRLPPQNFFLRQLLRLPIPEFVAKFIKTKKTIPILNDISGLVESGKMLAIMGPTGSGKTTLLNVLARRVKMNVTGDILINGSEVKGRRLKRRMAYVLQDDVFFPNITVRDTITTTANLRLPRKLGKERKERVNEVLSELGLNRCSNTIIGGPFARGVSGGERKRCNIANEIVNNSSLIFLDEPTSGLDASTAMGLIVTMKNLARHGHTVVTTIHQPSSAMFMLFDRILLLAEGGFPVYHGAARDVAPYFSSLGLMSPSNYNPADFMLELVTTNEKVEDGRPVKQYLIEKYQELKTGGSEYLIPERPKASFDDEEEGKDEDDNLSDKEKEAVKDMKHGPKYPTPFWLQMWLLAVRAFKQRRADIINWQHTFQLLVIAILAGLLWLDMDYKESSLGDRSGLLFFATMFWCLHSWMNALYSFPPERAVLNKERATGAYRLSAYFLGKTIAELPLELILPFMANTIIYWMSGLNRDGYTYIIFLLLTWLFVIMGGSLGLLISAYFMDVKQGVTFTVIVVLISILLGGFFIARQNLRDFIAWARWISFIKYAYEATLINEFKLPKDVTFTPSNPSQYTDNPITGQDVLDHYGVETTIWADFIFLVGVIVVARLLAYLSLRFLNKVKM
eukprot:TRINITY_DN1945_c0_g1_i1.p1 TRINITY_DN1945_c0_g1~~TRINITY_DN1945_c0_g1_i1.p1  ORF type:complete len:724 (-),score=171.23 TRINITY_DN1945_c0_g1_i1:51-2222(-)